MVDEYRRQIKQLNLVIEGLHKDVKNAWKWCEEAYEDALKELHESIKEMKRALKEKETDTDSGRLPSGTKRGGKRSGF